MKFRCPRAHTTAAEIELFVPSAELDEPRFFSMSSFAALSLAPVADNFAAAHPSRRKGGITMSVYDILRQTTKLLVRVCVANIIMTRAGVRRAVEVEVVSYVERRFYEKNCSREASPPFASINPGISPRHSGAKGDIRVAKNSVEARAENRGNRATAYYSMQVALYLYSTGV